jgi:hypothetical protein
MIAAMRDNFVKWPGEGMAEFAHEASMMIKPDRKKKETRLRIEMREKDGQLLKLILGRGAVVDEAQNKAYDVDMSNRKKLKSLSDVDRRIVDVFGLFDKRICELGVGRALKVFDYLRGSVFLLVSIPPNARMARNMVTGQRRGKNFEPVDEFKGLVCFALVADEKVQDEVLDKWIELQDSIGRKLLETACLALAQGELCEALRRDGESDLMEKYVRQDTVTNKYDGASFFKYKIFPAASLLKDFRENRLDFGIVADPPSMPFLKAACDIPASKEIELVVLAMLMKLKSADSLAKQLKKLERVALWMMLAKPKLPLRRKRCFSIINSLNDPDSLEDALKLSSDEKETIRSQMDEQDFGKTVSGRRLAMALLDGLNEHHARLNNQASIQAFLSTLQVEHVLPQKWDGNPSWKEEWAPNEAERWLHRIGNLALLNQKANSKISNRSFSMKRPDLGDSIYPLTRRISKYKCWDANAIETNHKEFCRLAAEVWCL